MLFKNDVNQCKKNWYAKLGVLRSYMSAIEAGNVLGDKVIFGPHFIGNQLCNSRSTIKWLTQIPKRAFYLLPRLSKSSKDFSWMRSSVTTSEFKAKFCWIRHQNWPFSSILLHTYKSVLIGFTYEGEQKCEKNYFFDNF